MAQRCLLTINESKNPPARDQEHRVSVLVIWTPDFRDKNDSMSVPGYYVMRVNYFQYSVSRQEAQRQNG